MPSTLQLEYVCDGEIGAVLGGTPKPVYLKADENLPYGFVIRVLAVLDQVGVEQVGMVTQPESR